MNEQTSYERHIIELETIQRAKCMQNLYDKNKQLQEEAIFRETLLDMMRSKNKKLEQKVEELEAEQDVKDKRKTCLNCQMLRPTTDSKVKLCGSYFQKGSLFSQPTSIVFLKNHCCQNHVSF